jgi:hypothetical protein
MLVKIPHANHLFFFYFLLYSLLISTLNTPTYGIAPVVMLTLVHFSRHISSRGSQKDSQQDSTSHYSPLTGRRKKSKAGQN